MAILSNIISPSGVATLSTSQTLSNKTLTACAGITATGAISTSSTVTGTNLAYLTGAQTLDGKTLTGCGSITISATAARIIGDFSNATISSRLMFQNSNANSTSDVSIIPSGTGTVSAITVINNSDPTNAGFAQLSGRTTEARLSSGITGTGTYVPLTFYTGGAERARIDTSGHFTPGATNSYDLGSTTLRWRNIYTQDLHLSNGIGDYTVIEGEENLYLVNNKNGKSFKFALIEVDASEVPPKSEA